MSAAAKPPRAPRWPRPDFMPRRHRASWIAWLALAAAFAALVFAVIDWQAARQEAERQREDARRWQRDVRKLAPAASTRPPPAASAAREESRRMAAAQVAHALVHPWAQVMQAAERATPEKVQWLAMSHTRADGQVRLEGVAADTEGALAVVDRLSAEPGWSGVTLARLAVAEGSGAMRFEIAAKVGAR